MARNSGGRLKALLFLFLSVGMALLAAGAMYTVVKNMQAELIEVTVEEEVQQVVVAAANIAPAETIQETHLKLTELPPMYIPANVLREPDQAINRVPRERILVGEFIREERLADPQSGLGMTAIVPKGMRAITMNLAGGSAVSGFLNPGNHVDVIVTISRDNTGAPPETTTLLQAVEVLAVNEEFGGKAQTEARRRSKPAVTLALTPSSAEKLTHAEKVGDVILSLRGDIDVSQRETRGATAKDLLGGETEERRINVKDWMEQRTRDGNTGNRDGSTIMIRGKDVSRD